MDIVSRNSMFGFVEYGATLGMLNATDQEIEEAARKANALDFIISFPEQMDTLVGDKGSNTFRRPTAKSGYC